MGQCVKAERLCGLKDLVINGSMGQCVNAERLCGPNFLVMNG